MTKQMIPLIADDISVFSRALAKQLTDVEKPPSHLTLMNMVSRAAGFRNFQHLRSAHTIGEHTDVLEVKEAIDHSLVKKALNQFDDEGRLIRWPSRRQIQEISLWALWARIPSGVYLQEPDVNALLLKEHLFHDTAILRRSLFGLGLVTRNKDGSDYRRCEQKPSAEARALIRILEVRCDARPQ